jgi:hypothetical protein
LWGCLKKSVGRCGRYYSCSSMKNKSVKIIGPRIENL